MIDEAVAWWRGWLLELDMAWDSWTGSGTGDVSTMRRLWSWEPLT